MAKASSIQAGPGRRPRSGALVEQLRQALLDGQFAPGSRLNEVHLSRSLEVSRTPLRSALQMLAGEGLLHYTPNKGFTVPEQSLATIVDAYEMRALAEGLAARLAAERGLSEAQRASLDASLAAGDAALADGAEPAARRAAYAAANEIFHGTIHEAAGSSLVRDVVRLCQRVPQASAHNIVAFDLDDMRQRHALHHRIYDAILGREPREAEALMRQHVLSVKLSMARAFARRLPGEAAAPAPAPGAV
ncbi:GntR family transcriptional regulator [Phreatobacter sp. AB_2022a]|uniref:GntR family transcriptional regulator n=1 Tax=Phreatobacter sp. AB_2022a TaxID=3003134 RepID=UPI002286DA06|nr:GntR family transcriptional regulator [Phreatobacter sp. AB_2022a]MCZ0733206.1 GntR family transcriptional regulator [Phreatobacter sp. AB_2022a]